jgi:hypothetical protein
VRIQASFCFSVAAVLTHLFQLVSVAASNEDGALARPLLEMEADIDARGDGGLMELNTAALSGDAALMRALLEKEANVEAKDSEDMTVLLSCYWKRTLTLTRRLIMKRQHYIVRPRMSMRR